MFILLVEVSPVLESVVSLGMLAKKVLWFMNEKYSHLFIFVFFPILSPWRIVDDCGGAFTMGTIGGGIFQAIKGFRNSPVVSG